MFPRAISLEDAAWTLRFRFCVRISCWSFEKEINTSHFRISFLIPCNTTLWTMTWPYFSVDTNFQRISGQVFWNVLDEQNQAPHPSDLFAGTIRSRPEIIFWEVLYAGVPDTESMVLQSGCHPTKPLTWFSCSIREHTRTTVFSIQDIYI